MKLNILFTLLFEVFLNSFSLGFSERKKYSNSFNLRHEINPECDVTKDNLCCCIEQEKHYFWPANQDKLCFFYGVNVNCQLDSAKRNTGCFGITSHCLYDEKEYLDFR